MSRRQFLPSWINFQKAVLVDDCRICLTSLVHWRVVLQIIGNTINDASDNVSLLSKGVSTDHRLILCVIAFR